MRSQSKCLVFVIVILLFSLVGCSPRLPFPKDWESKLQNGKTLEITFYSVDKTRKGASTIYFGEIRALDAEEILFWGNYEYTFFDKAEITHAPTMIVNWHIKYDTIKTDCQIDENMFLCMDDLGGREFLLQAFPKNE